MNQPPPTPAFPMGYPVRVGYLGLYRVYEQPTNSHGQPIDGTRIILGCRLQPGTKEDPTIDDPDGHKLHYWHGWEYAIGPDDVNVERWHEKVNWYEERDLLEKGYDPNDPSPWKRTRDTFTAGRCDRCKLLVPNVRDGDLCKTCADAMAEVFVQMPDHNVGGEG